MRCASETRATLRHDDEMRYAMKSCRYMSADDDER